MFKNSITHLAGGKGRSHRRGGAYGTECRVGGGATHAGGGDHLKKQIIITIKKIKQIVCFFSFF